MAISESDPEATIAISSRLIGQMEMTDTPTTTAPTMFSVIAGWLQSRSFLSKQIMLAAILPLAALAVLIIYIGPWQSAAEEDPDDPSVAWNKTIEKLGIFPVYPPQEDFYVGDIYLKVDSVDQKLADKISDYPGNASKARMVKIAHIDLRSLIFSPRHGLPTFQQTIYDGDKIAPRQPTAEAVPSTDGSKDAGSSDSINLALASFPGIKISRNKDSKAGFSWLRAARSTGDAVDLSIPVAESYGAPVVESLLALENFCRDKKTGGFCSDEVARKIMTYTLGKAISALYNGRYVYKISVTLVTQVYLTRQLDVDFATADLLTQAVTRNPPTVDAKSPPSDPPTEAKPPDSDGGQVGSGMSANYRLYQVYDRPLVFGYRAVSFALSDTKDEQPKGKEHKQ